jgi:hypothetical protein
MSGSRIVRTRSNDVIHLFLFREAAKDMPVEELAQGNQEDIS